MKHAVLQVLGVVTAALLTLGAAPARADAVGPYYATPSWDQTLPASTRFVVLSNFNSSAVLDRETGLVWAKVVPLNFFSWYQAQDYCSRLNLGSRLGWRLPTIEELATLIDGANPSTYPPLPAGHPFTLGQTGFWSATLSAQFPGYARNLYFVPASFPGEVAYEFQFDQIDGSHSQPAAWCVRGGLNVNPQ